MPNKETLDEASNINLDELDNVKLPTQVKGKIEFHGTPTIQETLDKIVRNQMGHYSCGPDGCEREVTTVSKLQALIATSNKEAVIEALTQVKLTLTYLDSKFKPHPDARTMAIKQIDARIEKINDPGTNNKETAS